MAFTLRTLVAVCAFAGALAPAAVSAQINFNKTGYYLSLGDSLPAGEGALPVTQGFVYQLYERGVFAPTQELDFANIAVKGATTDDVLLYQVPEALCIRPPRIAVGPSVITLMAGANDFLLYIARNGIPPNPIVAIPQIADGIAARVETIIRALVFGAANLPSCPTTGIPGVKILVGNYYSFDHPDAQIAFLFDLALQAFRASLANRVASIQADIAASGKTARVGYVDLYTALAGNPSFLLINKPNGFVGGLSFEIHPTNAGHSAMSRAFENVWTQLQ